MEFHLDARKPMRLNETTEEYARRLQREAPVQPPAPQTDSQPADFKPGTLEHSIATWRSMARTSARMVERHADRPSLSSWHKGQAEMLEFCANWLAQAAAPAPLTVEQALVELRAEMPNANFQILDYAKNDRFKIVVMVNADRVCDSGWHSTLTEAMQQVRQWAAKEKNDG